MKINFILIVSTLLLYENRSFILRVGQRRGYVIKSSSSDLNPVKYDIGLGKNIPLSDTDEISDQKPQIVNNSFGDIGDYWSFTLPVQKNLKPVNFNDDLPSINNTDHVPPLDAESKQDFDSSNSDAIKYDIGLGKNIPVNAVRGNDKGSIILANDSRGKFLTRALWQYGLTENQTLPTTESINPTRREDQVEVIQWEDIDPSVPLSVYDPSLGVDLVWDLMRQEAKREAAREPLLVSFIYSTILNHPSLESALAFHLSNRLASSAMLSTQIMSLFLEAFGHDEFFSDLRPNSISSFTFGKSLRADILAVRSRDPACTCLPDVFLYFKGFQALQTHRVAHYLWKNGRKTLANFFQSQMAQTFQIDIHPNARIGHGIMLDHGTGVVIGETAVLGDNCSVLHHVTLGGSGKRGNDRHPKIGNGVLLGAGATVLGNIHVGDGCQIGAGTLVIEDLPPHSVAVGVPARIIGKFVNQNEVPSTSMDQMLDGAGGGSNNIEFSI